VLFFAQFLTPHSIVPRDVFSLMYVALAAIFAVRQLIEMHPYFPGRYRQDLGSSLGRPPP
jgi:hypothetical protein